MKIKKNLLVFALALGAVLVLGENCAYADDLPWDTGIKKIRENLTGPVASGLSLIGLIAAGATLIFGGEISGFLKSLIYMVLVISLIIAGNAFITNVMGGKLNDGSGATIAYVAPAPAYEPVQCSNVIILS